MPRSGADGGDTGGMSVSEIEELFLEYHPRVFSYVRYRVADVEEAEDLTSDIMERALRYLSSYDQRKGAFSTWIFSIAHNTWVNYVKRQKRRDPYHVDLGDEVETMPASDPLPEQSLVHQEQVSHLLECLGTLPERQQEILSLRFAGRLTNREIAHVLSMNERTVGVTILRALRKLRRQLEEAQAI
jgi:RNA polymerase sigma factor (sigma-70 family)